MTHRDDPCQRRHEKDQRKQAGKGRGERNPAGTGVSESGEAGMARPLNFGATASAMRHCGALS